MTKAFLFSALENYENRFPDEKEVSIRIKNFLLSSESVFHNFYWQDGHITASILILNQKKTKVLLIFHKKLQKWLQFGGHSDDSPDVLGTAIREFHEESWVKQEPEIIRYIENSHFPIFDIDIHIIPPDAKWRPLHKHYDIRFLWMISDAIPLERQIDEVDDIQWFDLENVEKEIEDVGTLRMIQKIKSL